jgi:predicted HNH restriction endonuclease
MCGSCRTKIRRIRTKIAAVKYLGGKCSKCGWEYQNILEIACYDFHHPNENKETDVCSILQKSWERALEEIKKCVLLCSNCHRMEHCDRDQKIIDAVLDYKGSVLTDENGDSLI